MNERGRPSAADDGDARVTESSEADAEDEAEEVPADDRPRLVRFALGDRTFLVAADAVQEVLVSQSCTRLPGAPPALIGIINVRGRIVAVVDPRHLLHADSVTSDPDRILVIATPAGPVGLLVDRVDEVITAEPDPVPTDAGTDHAGIMVAIVALGSTTIDVVDPIALIDAAIGHVPTESVAGRV